MTYRSINRFNDWSIYRSIYRSIDIDRFIYRFIDLFIDRSIYLSIYRSIDWLIDWLIFSSFLVFLWFDTGTFQPHPSELLHRHNLSWHDRCFKSLPMAELILRTVVVLKMPRARRTSETGGTIMEVTRQPAYWSPNARPFWERRGGWGGHG